MESESKKGIAALLVEAAAPPELKGDEHVDNHRDLGEMAVADELMEAFKSGDRKLLISALRNFLEINA